MQGENEFQTYSGRQEFEVVSQSEGEESCPEFYFEMVERCKPVKKGQYLVVSQKVYDRYCNIISKRGGAFMNRALAQSGVPNALFEMTPIAPAAKDRAEGIYQIPEARGDMDFGAAIREIKKGNRVARKGWNGKGMWIALTPGSSFAAACAKEGHAAFHRAQEMDDPHKSVNLLPHIDMRAADGSMVIGWLASQADMLAEDWYIVEAS